MLGAEGNLTINGSVLADGTSSNTTLASGGAGGSIQLWMQYLSGNGQINATGGNSLQYSGQGKQSHS